MILIKKCFYNDFHFVATPLIAYNIGLKGSSVLRQPTNRIWMEKSARLRNLLIAVIFV